MTAAKPIVAFDFDGTLTVRDTFLAFLRWRAGEARFAAGMARLAPAFGAHLLRPDVEKLKVAAIRRFLRGAPVAALEIEAETFAARSAPMLLRPDALKVWRQHQRDGARMVIVTASPEIVIAPFAKALGADRLLGTRLGIDDTGRVIGGLEGRNCRGAEKVRRLKEAFGEDVRLAAAYGDTSGDIEMLAIADQPFMRLFTGKPGARA